MRGAGRAGGRGARRHGARGPSGAARPGVAPLSAIGPPVAYPVTLQALVEDYLSELSFARERGTARLEEAMRYSLLAPAKRIRPVISLATAETLGRDPGDVLPLAAAIELVHTYSLIHDDLPAMDDDGLRRGQPTCHVAYGEDVAILAGDGLFAEAIRLVLERQEGEPAHVLTALHALVAAAGIDGMVGGQYLDVAGFATDGGPGGGASAGGGAPAGAGDSSAAEAGGTEVADSTAGGTEETHSAAAELRRLHERKTGRLIAASVECVVLLCGATGPATMALRRFAAELGVLFQIVDDILDVTGDEGALGKSRGSDARHGKRTYVSVFGLSRARELATDSHRLARAALGEADRPTERLAQVADYILTRTS